MKNDPFKTVIKRFEEFTVTELYEVLALRQQVFVVEQNCVYQDLDGLDDKAIHIFMKDQDQNRIIAYARIFPPGVVNDHKAVIGRVVVHEEFRNKGLGNRIMVESIEFCKRTYTGQDIKISAQTYLESFYTALGFVDTGVHYLEDGIPHMAMILSISNNLKR